MTKSELKKLDAKLDYWAKTDKEQRAARDRWEAERAVGMHRSTCDTFDVVAYQKMIYSNGWNR